MTTCVHSFELSAWNLTRGPRWRARTERRVGILLDPTPEYAALKANLSHERQERLTLAEEEIQADPDRIRYVDEEGASYHFTDDFVAVKFHLGRRQFLAFSFYEDAGR